MDKQGQTHYDQKAPVGMTSEPVKLKDTRVDPDGNVRLARERDIRNSANRNNLFLLPDDFQQNRWIRSMAASENDVWLGFSRELLRFRIKEKKWERIYLPGRLVDAGVSHLVLAGDYLAVRVHEIRKNKQVTSGIYLYNLRTKDWKRVNIRKYARPRYWDGTSLWLTTTQEIYLLRPKSEDLKIYNHKKFSFLKRHHIKAIDSDGINLWMATLGKYDKHSKEWKKGGVIKMSYDFKQIEEFSLNNGLVHDYNSNIVADERYIWVTHKLARRGLSVYDKRKQKWSRYVDASNNSIGGRFVASEGLYLWVSGGLDIYRIDKKNRSSKKFVPNGFEDDPRRTIQVLGLTKGASGIWSVMSGGIKINNSYPYYRKILVKLPAH